METSGLIWPTFISSKLSCMPSLPVSLKRITSITSKKNNTVFQILTLSVAMETSCWVWPNFELIQALMHVLIACKYEKDQMKTSGENMMASFSPLLGYGIFFRRSRAANSVVHGRISPNFELIQALMYIIVSFKYEMNPIKKRLRKRDDAVFPTIICCHGTSGRSYCPFQSFSLHCKPMEACEQNISRTA